MNTARAGRVGGSATQVFQLAGSLDAVVAVVGEYPETSTGEMRYNQFIAHLLADPQAESGRLSADQYQFPVDEPGEEAYHTVESFRAEHEERMNYGECIFKCDHAPLPSLFPNLNWTFQKGHYSYDQRKARFGYTTDLDIFSQAPDTIHRPGYEAALARLWVMVSEAKAQGLRSLRMVISATNPLTLPPFRFSDQRVREQQVLVNRCMELCCELGGQVSMEFRNVDSLRKFTGPRNTLQHYGIEDHAIPHW